MSSSRALWALSALAIVSVAAVTIDLATGDGGVRGTERLFRSFDVRAVEEIRWELDGARIVVGRRGEQFRLLEPRQGAVRASAIDAFFGALANVQPMRAGKEVGDVAAMTSVEVVAPGSTLRFSVALDESEQFAWIERSGRRFPVEAYVGRELTPRLEDLRARRPFGGLARYAPTGVAVEAGEGSVIIEGPPWQVLMGEPKGRLFADPEVVSEVERLLRGLSYQSFLESDESAGHRGYVRVRLGGTWQELFVLGPCDGGYRVSGEIGAGCVASEGMDRIFALMRRPGLVLDRHLVILASGSSVNGVRISRGEAELVVRRSSNWTAKGQQVDPSRVLAWLRRLDDLTGGEPVAVPSDLAPAYATVAIETDAGETYLLSFHRHRGRVWARRGNEPALWPILPAEEQIVQPAVEVFAGLEVIPFASADLVRAIGSGPDGTAEEVIRGELLGEWQVERGVLRRDVVRSLVSVVGYLHASESLASGAPAGPPERTVRLFFVESLTGSARAVVELRLWMRTDRSCLAQVGEARGTFVLAASDCAPLLGPWTGRR